MTKFLSNLIGLVGEYWDHLANSGGEHWRGLFLAIIRDIVTIVYTILLLVDYVPRVFLSLDIVEQ